jgi:hypothetical protein
MNEASEMVIPEQPASPDLKTTEGANSEVADMLKAAFGKQRESYLADPVPNYDQRKRDTCLL